MSRRAEYAAAFERLKSYTAVGREFGVNESTVRRSLAVPQAVVDQCAAVGADPDRFSHGWLVTPREDGGRASSFWKAPPLTEQEQHEALEGRLEGFRAELPRYAPAPAPLHALPRLANVLAIADAHLGMLAWRREGGTDWDTRIAEDMIFEGVKYLIDAAPKAAVLYLVFLGDWRHFERRDPVTNFKLHVLAADSRIRKVNEIAVRLKRRIIDYALSCYARVEVIDSEGNHDETSFSIDVEWTKQCYRDEPRLNVIDDTALPYHAVQHGEVMLMFHHGHIRSPKKAEDRKTLALWFADAFPRIWASTTARYCHTGHMHHAWAGWDASTPVWWEQHPTLAAADSYPARLALRSMRAATIVTYDVEDGEVERKWVTPGKLERLRKNREEADLD